jgi:hypothetical protein
MDRTHSVGRGADSGQERVDREGDFRQIGLIRRRADLSMTQFSDHWRTVHARLGLAALTTATAYVQYHRLVTDSPPPDLRPAGYDGMAVVWFATAAGAAAVAGNEQYRATVAPDEPDFLDAHADNLVARGHVLTGADITQDRPQRAMVILLRGARGRVTADDIAAALRDADPALSRLEYAVPDISVDAESPYAVVISLWADTTAGLLTAWQQSSRCREQLHAMAAGEPLTALLANPIRVRWT